MKLNIYQILEKLKGRQQTESMQAKYIYQDEQTGEIKETPLSDSAAASVYFPIKSIRNLMFG